MKIKFLNLKYFNNYKIIQYINIKFIYHIINLNLINELD